MPLNTIKIKLYDNFSYTNKKKNWDKIIQRYNDLITALNKDSRSRLLTDK